MRKLSENQVKEITALLKFGNYSISHEPPVIWRENVSLDYGFDGELEFTQRDVNDNIIPTGQVAKVVIKATSRFSDSQRSIQFSVKNLEFYKEYLLDVLLVVYDIEHDRLFAKELTKVSLKEGLRSQRIKFDETDELRVGDNKLFGLLNIPGVTIQPPRSQTLFPSRGGEQLLPGLENFSLENGHASYPPKSS